MRLHLPRIFRLASAVVILCLLGAIPELSNAAVFPLQGSVSKQEHSVETEAPYTRIVSPLQGAVSQQRPADDNENSTPTEWWMYAGQTPAEVDNILHGRNARIVNIKYDNFSPYPFTAVYVPNTGAYGRQWWWFYGIDEATLKKQLQANNARLVSLKAYDNGQGQLRFTVAMMPIQAPMPKAGGTSTARIRRTFPGWSRLTTRDWSPFSPIPGTGKPSMR